MARIQKQHAQLILRTHCFIQNSWEWPGQVSSSSRKMMKSFFPWTEKCLQTDGLGSIGAQRVYIFFRECMVQCSMYEYRTQFEKDVNTPSDDTRPCLDKGEFYLADVSSDRYLTLVLFLPFTWGNILGVLLAGLYKHRSISVQKDVTCLICCSTNVTVHGFKL